MHIALDSRGIQVLDFSSHHSESADPKDVVALQVIESVNASHNKIRNLIHISVFTSLRILDLSHNRLASPVLEWLRALPEGLEELNLSHNEIATIESARGERTSIGHCFGTYTPRLRKLNLSHNILHASASAESDSLVGATARDGHSSRIEELNLDHNTGIFSLNELLGGLARLTTLSCIGNHIATLEGIAAVAVSCPALLIVKFASCAVSERLQEASFLWNVIGGSIFQYKSGDEQRTAQRDMAKLSEYFFAVFVSQVLPSVEHVDGISVSEAQDLVGPLIRVAPPPPRNEDQYAEINASTQSAAAPTVAATEAPEEYDEESGGSEDQSSYDTDEEDHTPERQGRIDHREHSPPMSPSQIPTASEAAQRYGTVMAGYQPDLTGNASRSRSAPQHVLERLDFLHKRAVELQEFIAASQKQTRHFEKLRLNTADALKRQRQDVADQRVELAALRVERSSQKEMIRSLQHLIQKKTRELDHAEVANIRVVEKKITSLIHEKENVIRSKAAKVSREKLRQQSNTGVDAATLSRKPTRSSLRQLEETQRRLRGLKESSPTAAIGSRFVYNEFGNPELAGDRLDAERFPRSGHMERQSLSPQVASRELLFTTVSGASDDSPTQHDRRRSLSQQEQQIRRPSASKEPNRRDSSALKAPTISANDSNNATRVSLSPERSQTRDRARSTPDGTRHASASASLRARSLISADHVYGVPPRSPKLKRSTEPDHDSTTLTSITEIVEESVSTDERHGMSGAAGGQHDDESTTSLSNFRFPVDRRKSSMGIERRESVSQTSQRRQSSSTRDDLNHREQSSNDHEHSPQRRQESVTSPLHRLSTAAVENSPKRRSIVAAQANGDTSGDTPPLRRQSTSVGEHHRAIPDDASYRTGANRSSVSADTSPRRQSASANSERRPSESAFDSDRLRTGIGSSRSTTSIHSELRQSISIAEPPRRSSTTSALQRRASNVVPLKDVEHLPPWSEDDSNDNDNTDAAQQLVDRIVATTERRSTVTGHSLDGQLANPISTLDEMVSSSPPEQPLMSSSLHSSMYGGASNRRESRLLVGTTTQQSFHEFAEGSAVSIALQSPKKRISESAADATRRKPSEVVIEKAMREAQSLNFSLTSGDSVGSRPDAELSESRRVMMSADGMCAVARASHMPSRASVTAQQQHHRYDIPLHLSFSLDNSISRVKPDFRRNTTGGHTNTF